MTRTEFMAAILRRWYVLLAGGVATIATLAALLGGGGVYTTQVDVVMLPPSGEGQGNPIEGRSDSLIYFAAIVERELNNGAISDRYASAEATLAGAGVEHGYSVTLPNAGGQWQTNFGRPVLSVEVVDTDPDRVRAVLAEQIARVDTTVTQVQDAQGIPAQDRIVTGLSPAEPVVSYLGGSRSKTVLGVAALGVGLSISAALILDSWLRTVGSPVPARRRMARIR